MKHKILTLLVVLLATLAAHATVEYRLWIGSTQVTGDNLNNIYDESIKSGTARYDANNNKLILTDVTIQPSSGTRAIRNQDCTGLTIEFVGTCKLKTENAEALRVEHGFSVSGSTTIVATSGSLVVFETEGDNAIFTQTSITVKGPGSLRISSDYSDQTILCKGWEGGYVHEGYSHGAMYFGDECDVFITNMSSGNCIKGDNKSNLYFSGGTVQFRNRDSKPCIENIKESSGNICRL